MRKGYNHEAEKISEALKMKKEDVKKISTAVKNIFKDAGTLESYSLRIEAIEKAITNLDAKETACVIHKLLDMCEAGTEEYTAQMLGKLVLKGILDPDTEPEPPEEEPTKNKSDYKGMYL